MTEVVEPVADGKGEGIDFTQKHYLENNWTMWFDNPSGRQKQATWGASMRAVHTFNTVEDFWCLYNNIVTPARLVSGSDFSLFKAGIEPKWEDAANQFGGKWTFLLPKSTMKNQLDQYWLNLLLAAIGEHFEEPDEICGIVINIRNKQDRLSIWVKTATNESAQISIGKVMKAALEIGESGRLGFTAHDDSAKQDKKTKDRYTI
jgi:translation initiation factor 4E